MLGRDLLIDCEAHGLDTLSLRLKGVGLLQGIWVPVVTDVAGAARAASVDLVRLACIVGILNKDIAVLEICIGYD